MVLAALAASSAAAFRGHHVFVANRFCMGHTRRPAKIEIACGTGEFYAAGLRYSSYGGRKAHATGTLWLDDCTPNCAQGTFRSYPGRVVLKHIISCDRRYYYGVIRWVFTGTPPPGVERSGSQNIAPLMKTCSPVS
jgi:hypothetical protein